MRRIFKERTSVNEALNFFENISTLRKEDKACPQPEPEMGF